MSSNSHGLWGWRPLNGRPGLQMAVWFQVKACGCGLSLQPVGRTPALSVTQKSAAAVVACGTM